MILDLHRQGLSVSAPSNLFALAAYSALTAVRPCRELKERSLSGGYSVRTRSRARTATFPAGRF
jgi:hypothetical protein